MITQHSQVGILLFLVHCITSSHLYIFVSGFGNYAYAHLEEIGPDLQTEFSLPNLVADGSTCLEFYYQIGKGFLEVLRSDTDILDGNFSVIIGSRVECPEK